MVLLLTGCKGKNSPEPSLFSNTDHTIIFNSVDKNRLKANVSNVQVKVGIKDLSSQRLEVAEAYAKTRSAGKIILLYNGTDKTLIKKVYSGILSAAAQGANIGGMVLARSNPEFHLRQVRTAMCFT